MSSLLTNASAMTALQTLSLTNKNLATTQNRIATGLRVSEASDNAAYWSIATGMRAQNSALGAVKDSMNFGSSVVDTAYTALNEAISKTEEIFAKYVSLEQGGVDAGAVNAEITQLKQQVAAIAQNADFEGQNLLKTGGADLKVVTGYIKSSALPIGPIDNSSAEASAIGDELSATVSNFDKLSLKEGQTLTFTVGGTEHTVTADDTSGDMDADDIAAAIATELGAGYSASVTDGTLTLEFEATAADDDISLGGFTISTEGATSVPGVQSLTVSAFDLEAEIETVTDAASAEAALVTMRAAAAEIGASKMRLDSQMDFTSKLMDAIDRGIGALVDADMNAESARLSALQVQQQLGIQALSIANQNSQSILSLFR